jgi:plasmid maintenance system antidote protein VapI
MYNPGYQVSPGDIIAEYMEVYEITESKLAELLNITIVEMIDFLNGARTLGRGTLFRLSHLLNMNYEVLKNVEKKYQDFLNKK